MLNILGSIISYFLYINRFRIDLVDKEVTWIIISSTWIHNIHYVMSFIREYLIELEFKDVYRSKDEVMGSNIWRIVWF